MQNNPSIGTLYLVGIVSISAEGGGGRGARVG